MISAMWSSGRCLDIKTRTMLYDLGNRCANPHLQTTIE